MFFNEVSTTYKAKNCSYNTEKEKNCFLENTNVPSTEGFLVWAPYPLEIQARCFDFYFLWKFSF